MLQPSLAACSTGSGPELGDIDAEVCTPHLEKIQCETVDSSDDVFMPLMTVAQHQRIVAGLRAQLREANNLADQWSEKNAALSAQQPSQSEGGGDE